MAKHTADSLMAMFYGGARERGAITTAERSGRPVEELALTAKQFSWLMDLFRREEPDVPAGDRPRAQGTIPGVGTYEAIGQRYGSAIVIVRPDLS